MSTRWLNIALSQLSRTFLKVLNNITFVFKVFTAQTTAKLFVVRVYQLMRFQFKYCTETLWTSTTYIRLHTFMSK